MDEEHVLALVRTAVLHVASELDPRDVTPARTLPGLGLSVADRADVLDRCLRRLGVAAPLDQFLETDDLATLARRLFGLLPPPDVESDG